MTNDTTMENKNGAREPITWEDHEYIHFEKDSSWYWALALIVIAGAITSVIFGNILFAIFILIVGFVLALLASREPDVVTFSVSQRGIYVDDELHAYKALDAFGIDEISPRHIPQLIVRAKNPFSPHLIIPLENTDPEHVHHFLKSFLPEENLKEPLIHKVMEYFGF